MRTTFLFHTIFWCLLLGLTFTTFAQDQSSGRDLSREIQQPDEKKGLNTDLLQTAAYGTDAVLNNTLTEFDLPAGTIVGTIGGGSAVLVQGGDIGPGGLYYGTQNNNTLVTIDLTTGVFANVATITGVTAGQTITGVAYDETNNIMYLGSTDITTSQIFTLDITTGVASLVGSVGQPGLIGLAVNCTGQIYSLDLVQDNLWSIDPSTGVGTAIGPLGIDINFCQDPDFDAATGQLWFAAYAGTGQLGTVDLTTGAFTLVAALPSEYCSFAVQETCGPPCPVGQATDPTPANGATNIPLNGNTAMWTNGAGATSIEVFFDGASVYSGAPITSLSLAGVEPFNYSTTYTWRVDGSDGTCTTFGTTWTFTTLDDPNIVNLFCDDFEAGIGGWTITNNGGTCDWIVFNPPYPNIYTLPATSSGGVLSADADECGSGTTVLSTATLTSAIDATLYQTVWLEFDNDWNAIDVDDFCYVDVSTDGGTTWQNVLTFDGTDVRNTHENWDMTSLVALSNFNIRFVSVQPGWDWWWAVDNICIYGSDPIPVELTSFTANASEGLVELSWITATETNNSGFEVQRSAGGEFEAIAFVEGHGTTTETQAYTFADRNVNVGSYSYRLKQVDFDGTFEYSSVIEADVPAPATFALDQNYPNPFNPSTQIAFRLAVDSKVSLKVFDILGQEVITLVNTNLVAGAHTVNFDASALNSGVYLYRIEATGIDGANFMDVKKMILTK
ncbi:MAG: T9SS type A sorting domain-containing protein [Ignavibacteria bacterium]|nr:T9SS type A sorting domain-containing protein [Ignavibacteria bacterium]